MAKMERKRAKVEAMSSSKRLVKRLPTCCWFFSPLFCIL
jgi:hypothetical protein